MTLVNYVSRPVNFGAHFLFFGLAIASLLFCTHGDVDTQFK
jgi:hypothetical protein